ncbi:MAG: hydroxysqualene dehydroxylase HpnE [Rhodospirillaceae bacterium]
MTEATNTTTQSTGASPAGRVHIIGAGLAGLAAALRLSAAGVPVSLHEGAGHAGGRCRTYHDAALDRRIDNGNHLMLSGNWAVHALIRESGADPNEVLEGPAEARFPFFDLRDGARWCLRPNNSRLPWWVLRQDRRVPGTGPTDYLSGLAFLRAKPGQTVADLIPESHPLYKRFWEPVTIAVLNAHPKEAAAHLLTPVLLETFGQGGLASCPRWAKTGLSDALVDPCLAALNRNGTEVRMNHRVRALERGSNSADIAALVFGDGERIVLAPEDRVILAVPAPVAASLLPDLGPPDAFRAIVNAHYRLDCPVPPGFEQPLGLIGGTAEWLFLREDVLSVTISAADALATQDPAAIAQTVWEDCCKALGLDPATAMPAHRIVKEKRATFAQTPAQVTRRPKPGASGAGNLILAGDWVDTALPATIEGSIRSGFTAAKALENKVK